MFPHERDARGAPAAPATAIARLATAANFGSFLRSANVDGSLTKSAHALDVSGSRRAAATAASDMSRTSADGCEHATRLRILCHRRDDIGVHLVQIYGFVRLRIDEGFAGPVRERRFRADASLLVGSGTFAETRAGGVVSKKRGGKGRRDEIGASFDGARAVRPRDR